MKQIAGYAICLGILVALGATHFKISKSIGIQKSKNDSIMLPPFSTMNPRIINVATLGHRGVFDDFIHVWFNHYLVDATHLKKYPEDAVKIGNVVLNTRPMIETSYMLVCFVFVRDIAKPQYCEPVIQAGMQIFPRSFMLPMTLGFIFYTEIKDPARAAAYYAIAARSEKAPPHIIRVARKLLSKKKLDSNEIESITNDFENLMQREAVEDLINIQEETPDD